VPAHGVIEVEPRNLKETTMDARLNLYDSTMAAKFLA